MSYHVEQQRFGELPDQIVVREDGYMDAYKNEGEPIVDYVYTLGGGECELHDCEGSFSAVNRPVWRCDCGAFMRESAQKYPELYVDFGWPGGSYMVDADMAEHETRRFARQLAELRGEGEAE
jgi:hypothetical protein